MSSQRRPDERTEDPDRCFDGPSDPIVERLRQLARAKASSGVRERCWKQIEAARRRIDSGAGEDRPGDHGHGLG